MRFKTLAFLGVVFTLLACSLTANALTTNIMAIQGSVTMADGTLAPNGLTVKVTNTTQTLSGNSQTGDNGDGKYIVSFIDFTKTVAATGDEIVVVATCSGTEYSATYTLTDADINDSVATLDISTECEDKTQKLVVSGVVYESDGVTPLGAGLTVNVSNIDRGLSAPETTTGAQGQYSATLEVTGAGEYAAASGETIEVTVTDADGNTVATISKILTASDVRSQAPSVDVTGPASTSIMAIQGSVFMADGTTLAPNDLTVTVANTTRDLSGTGQTGGNGDGKYIVSFIDFLGKTQAATGDKIDVVVKDGHGKERGTKSYILQTSDILDSTATIDVKTNIVATTQTLVVSGTVFESDGVTPVGVGYAVSVSSDRELSAEAMTDDQGNYSATLEVGAGKFAAEPNDVITVMVTDETGKEAGKPASKILIKADVEAKEVAINFTKVLPGLIVKGGVLEATGQLLAANVAAIATVTVGDMEKSADVVEGEYSVQFEAEEKALMADGDEITVVVTGADGTVYGKATPHTLTQAELDTTPTIVELDVTTNRVSDFSIAGKVLNVLGNPVGGVTVSARGATAETDANGGYELILTYATSPIAGDEITVLAVWETVVEFTKIQKTRSVPVQIDDAAMAQGSIEVTDIKVGLRLGGLTVDTRQHMEVLDKAVAKAGLPISIRTLVRDNPQYMDMISPALMNAGPLGLLVLNILTAPAADAPKIFSQWEGMDLENFGNAIMPPKLINLIHGLGTLEANLPNTLAGNQLQLYLITPSDVGDVTFEFGTSPMEVGEPIASGGKILHAFQLDEEMILLQLPGEVSPIDSVALRYFQALEFEQAPERIEDYTDVTMEDPDLDGIWTASVELDLDTFETTKCYYFFEVLLKEPMTVVVEGEQRQVGKWIMHDPKNLQFEDRGLFNTLFNTSEWLALFNPLAEALVAGEDIAALLTEELISEFQTYLFGKWDEIVTGMLDNYDPQMVSMFKIPLVADNESLWVARLDIDQPDGDYDVVVEVKDGDDNVIDTMTVTVGLDKEVSSASLTVAPGKNVLGYTADDTLVIARTPSATELDISVLELTAEPGGGDDITGILFQILNEESNKWIAVDSLSALALALNPEFRAEMEAKLTEDLSDEQKEYIQKLLDVAQMLSLADPGMEEQIISDLGEEGAEDLETLIGILGRISWDPTDLTPLEVLITPLLGGSQAPDFIGITQTLLNMTPPLSLLPFASGMVDLRAKMDIDPITGEQTRIMLLPDLGEYSIRAVAIDAVLNMDTRVEPKKIKIVPAEADKLQVVEPSELQAADESPTLVAEIIHRTEHPLKSAVFQYALGTAPDAWINIATVDLAGQELGVGDKIEVTWEDFDFEGLNATDEKILLRAVATNALDYADPEPAETEVELVAAFEFTLVLSPGLNIMSVPLADAVVIDEDGEPVKDEDGETDLVINTIGNLKTVLGDALVAFYHYDTSVGKFLTEDIDDTEIDGNSAFVVQMLSPVSIKFQGLAWPGTLALKAGLNVAAVPLANAFATIGDLKTALGEDLVAFYHYDTEIGKFRTEDIDAIEVKGGGGYVVQMLADVSIPVAGDPWANEESTAAPAGWQLRVFDPTSTLILGVNGTIVNEDTDLALSDLSVTVRHLSSKIVLTDTIGSHSKDGRFSVVFLDIVNNHSVNVGDIFKIDLSNADGTLKFESVRHIVTEEDIRHGRIALGELFARVIPKHSQLLQNYPNPFNPETWIPFQLSKDVDVTIKIYDVRGRIVRQLNLGYIPAGIYQTKAKAAYWNGANNLGERVSSGVYFYHIQADSFSASRKMVILK